MTRSHFTTLWPTLQPTQVSHVPSLYVISSTTEALWPTVFQQKIWQAPILMYNLNHYSWPARTIYACIVINGYINAWCVFIYTPPSMDNHIIKTIHHGTTHYHWIISSLSWRSPLLQKCLISHPSAVPYYYFSLCHRWFFYSGRGKGISINMVQRSDGKWEIFATKGISKVERRWFSGSGWCHGV